MVRKNDSIAEGYQKILKLLLLETYQSQREFLVNPTDPETIHQLRVKIREFRSMLSFLKPVLNQVEYLEIQKQLRAAAQIFSRIRELDVLMGEWGKLQQRYPEIESVSRALKNTFIQERESELEKIYPAVVNGEVSTVLINIQNRVNRIFVVKNQSINVFTERRYEALRKAAKRKRKKTDLSQYKSIHATRIQTKKLRYISGVLEPYFSCVPKREDTKWKALQENLGQICDIHRNIEVINEICSKYNNISLHYECGILLGQQVSLIDQKINKFKKSF